MEHNAVKSPLHYTEGRRFEPKDVIRDWDLNFNLGSAILLGLVENQIR